MRHSKHCKSIHQHMRNASFLSYAKYIVFIIIIFTSISVYSQPPIEIPSQVNPMQVDPKTLTQPQLRSLLGDKNQQAGKDINADLMNSKVVTDSVTKDNVRRKAYSAKDTYGSNVFTGSAVTDLSELSTPPLDYPIGVGDHIIVALWGGAEFQENYIVARDGAIFPQGLGKINVQGLTFDNARSIIYARFRSVVPPNTNISISLGQPRTINVNVVGEVEEPGPVTVSAFSNAFNVIGHAGGISEFGNLRNIQIKRGGAVIDEIDVYEYLNTGDFGKHIYLQNNDFVIIGIMEKKVLATGQFKRPMYYQLRKDEGVKALLKYTGGITPDGLGSAMKVIRSEDEIQVQRDVNANAIIKLQGQDFLLKDGDIVKVDLIRPGIRNKVEIRGEVAYPDYYELRKADRLFDVINRAGGVTTNTYLQRAYIFRGAGDSTNLQSDKLEVDLSDVNRNNLDSKNNVLLQANDIIQLFAVSEFGDQQFVEIYGEVRKEGKVRKYGGMTLQDLLYLSGGIKQSAEFGRLEISSIVDVDSARQGLKPTRTLVKSYAINPDLRLDEEAAHVKLKPYDQIFVRKNPTFELQQNISMEGLIKYPGLYPRLNQYERLSSYIDRAGGFKDNANLAGAILYRSKTEFFRERFVKPVIIDTSDASKMTDAVQAVQLLDEPVSIDLYKALKYRNSKHDIVLQAGDRIVIPEINPFVSIQGKVQSPLKIAFDKEHTNLNYYIDKAGGFGVRPWRKRIFVTYANGKSRRTRTLLFFRFYPPVEEGAMVTVPSRPQGQEVSDITKSILVSAVPVILTGIIFKYVK
ncbi:MAG: SLBB domain-containing protein [Ferruginibacter sp.]